MMLLLSMTAVCAHAELQAIATVQVYKAEGEVSVSGAVEALFRVYVINRGTDVVRLPTGGGASAADGTATSISEELSWHFKRAPNVTADIIPSESELKIVVLKKDEVALIEWKKSFPKPEQLAGVRVKVSVDKKFARRFQLWCGELILEKVIVHWM